VPRNSSEYNNQGHGYLFIAVLLEFWVAKRREMTRALRFLATVALCASVCPPGFVQEPYKAPLDVAAEDAKASQGDISAMVKLGLAYWGKQGIPTDLERGKMWLSRAAEAGSFEAQMFLGAAYLSGNGLEKNPSLAAKYFLQVAQRQSVDGTL
jgi:TPR repeat protein